jgi:hypothetical protein
MHSTCGLDDCDDEYLMNPSQHSWPSWPPYFYPERARVTDGRGARATMTVWAIAVLALTILVLAYMLWRIV